MAASRQFNRSVTADEITTDYEPPIYWDYSDVEAVNRELQQVILVRDTAPLLTHLTTVRFGVVAESVAGLVVEWEGGTFTLMSIDGGHSFTPVLTDYRATNP